MGIGEQFEFEKTGRILPENHVPVDPIVIPAFERENRYLVLKRRDIRNALTELEQQILREITTKVRLYREGTMQKQPLECVVVESDWPEYEPTWKAIEDRMRG